MNVQNIVLDSQEQLWIVDSGIPPGATSALEYGAKIMSFTLDGRALRSYIIPSALHHDGMNPNDVRIDAGGYCVKTESLSELGLCLDGQCHDHM